MGVLALMAGCGGTQARRGLPAPTAAVPTPSEVVFRWASLVRYELNAEAGALFAPGAVVVQPGRPAIVLHDAREAELFNASLPCQAKVIAMWRAGDVVTALFQLGYRSTFACPGPLTTDAASFTIVDGRIVRWELLPDAD